MYLPSGVYHETYLADHAWWQATFVKAKMGLLVLFLLVGLPLAGNYPLSVANIIGYTILSALGVQLLIGYCGMITLGHAAFIAVGAYATAIGMLRYRLPYSVIMTTMADQFVTVYFIITHYVSRVGGRGHYFSLPPGTITIGPWVIDTEIRVYYLMICLVTLCTVGMANLLRTRVGRAWIAIRDNDIAAEMMGVNVVRYKLFAFFVAGVLGGIAGAFWISSLYVVSAEHFQFSWSLWLVGVILIGGVGSLHGVIFGSIFVTVLLERLQAAVIPLSDAFPALSTGFLYIKEGVFGVAIVLFLLYEPHGLAYRWQQFKNYFNLWPFAY